MVKSPAFFEKHSILRALLALLGWAALPAAAAAQVFCVTPVATPCTGRQVGDLLITDHANQAVLGLNPTNGYYLFSQAFNNNNASEMVDIIQNPTNPLHSLVIGDLNQFNVGIAQLDDCGNLLTPLFDNFVPPSSVLNIGGIINRDMAVDPLNGNLYSPSSPSLPVGNPPNIAIANGLFIFPPGGGNSTFVTVGGDFVNAAIGGACVFDEFGNLFTAQSGAASVVQYTAATLATASPTGAFLHGPENALSNITGMVYDGNGNLFLAGSDSSNHGGVWKTNIATGTTTQFCPGFGSVSPGGFFNVPFGITIDFNGNLWMVITNEPTFSSAGVVEINGTTGLAQQFFLLPATVGGVPFGSSTELDGISVLGLALPVHKCPPTATPTVTSTPTATPTSTPCGIVSPNLDLKVRLVQCNTNNQTVYRIFIRNNGPSPMPLSDLTIKAWAFDTGVTCWQLNSFFSGNIYTASGGFQGTNSTGFSMTATALNPACTATPGREANWEFDVVNKSSQTIPVGGYWIDGDFGVHACSFQNFNPGLSSWYSQIPTGQGSSCSDTQGNNPAGYFDDFHYALFFQGQLVNEAGGTDVNTGIPPCSGCDTGRHMSAMPLSANADLEGVEGTPTSTPTASPTPAPARELSVAAAPNVSKDGEPIQFRVSLAGPAQVKLTLFSLEGEPVYTSSLSGGAGENTLLWNLRNQAGSAVASGLYLYSVEISGGGSLVRKTGKVAVIH